jgi:two-component sensor histidine kinase
MKGDSIIKKIIYSSGFLAVIPALILAFFIPSLVSKYSMSVETENSDSEQSLYEDMNNDSIYESVMIRKGLPYFYIAIRDNNFHFYDQWNLHDSVDKKISGLFFGDFDHDGQKEVYVFTYKADSLFLNVNEMLQSHGTKTDRLYVTNIGFINKVVTSTVYPIGFFDQNGDGKDEFYFGITTGFRKDPRRIFYYDLVNKNVKSSPFTGIIALNPKMSDVNGDNKPEIFGRMSACGNFGVSVPYSDSSTWFMVFDKDLKFEFPPEEFRGYVNDLQIETYKKDAFSGYVLCHHPMGTDTTVMKARIMIYSSDGKLIRYRLVSDLGISGNLELMTYDSDKSGGIYIFSDKFIELNDKLEVVKTVSLPFIPISGIYRADIDGDGTEEFLLYSEIEGRLAVYSQNMDKLCEADLKIPNEMWWISKYYGNDHKYKIFLGSGATCTFITLNRNRFFFLGYLVYPGAYLLFFLFILLIKRINTLQVVEKESLNRRLVTLQLQAIKSQLDPHFTFNTLNSIASLIYLEDRELAYDYMNKFTQLLRGLINDAEMIYRSLGKELEFVTTYLELEKLRYGDKFNFEILIGENITQKEEVPKLVLHTFAENAIKHGIMSRKEGGVLKISVLRQNNHLILSVEDNGIGRKKAEGHSLSTGKGLRLTGEFYEILNKINRKPIKHLIIDLYDENKDPKGTRVEVWVPVDN